MNIRPIEKGIYVLADWDLSPDDKLTIAVHPYFKGAEANEAYVQARNKFFVSRENPILLMEETGFFKNRMERFCIDSKLNNVNAFAIKTNNETNCPKEIPWSHVYSFAQRFQQPIHFIGGLHRKVNYSEGPSFIGCLSSTVEKFINADFDIEIIDNVTFA